MSKTISGFSKFSKTEKIEWLVKTFFSNDPSAENTLKQYWSSDQELQELHDEFIENTVSNYYLPYGVAPNFVINKKQYVIPMAVEESSVVAAASLIAKFWSTRGGFQAEVISTKKIGQVHFMYDGEFDKLKDHFNNTKDDLLKATESITKNMRKRGGGILELELRDKQMI